MTTFITFYFWMTIISVITKEAILLLHRASELLYKNRNFDVLRQSERDVSLVLFSAGIDEIEEELLGFVR